MAVQQHKRREELPYTGSPLRLCWADIRLFFSLLGTLPGILIPLTAWSTGPLDELYPSAPNLFCLFLHTILMVVQSGFLLTLPFLVVLPVWAVVFHFFAVFAITASVARLLNGAEDVLYSSVNLGEDEFKHTGEAWIYINGVSIGKHWMQGNLDRLALTFRRHVIGVHNQTYGILFDLLQCIIERDFLYATEDVRRTYTTVKAAMLDPKNERVVLILHSQGGIEGGLILDWLLTQLPHQSLSKLEIYTFGCAANHYNNPRSQTGSDSTPVLRHIEHFASHTEFVARWGVLHFSSPAFQDRWAGRVFVLSGAPKAKPTGHLLNQHYLNAVFPLAAGEDLGLRVKEDGGETEVEVRGGDGSENGVHKLKDVSRLWKYRGGGVPE